MLIPLDIVLVQIYEASATPLVLSATCAQNPGSSKMYHFYIMVKSMHQIQNKIWTVHILRKWSLRPTFGVHRDPGTDRFCQSVLLAF